LKSSNMGLYPDSVSTVKVQGKSLLAELNQIISLLEAQIPANPQSPKNERLRLGLQRKLAKYFDNLEKAFPYSKLAGIYNRYVKE